MIVYKNSLTAVCDPRLMSVVKNADDTYSLTPDGGSPATILNPGGCGPVCLVCEHASAFIPDRMENLGLCPENRASHAVWDPGAYELTVALSERLDAPAVVSRVSRLVYDCNRPPEAPDAISAGSGGVMVPGNRDLTEADRARRVTEVYTPFHTTVARVLDGFARPPALMTVHSFAPVWFGTPREAELGLLHDADDGLARAMLAEARPGVRTALNEPYSAADGVTHSLALHALPRGLENVMIEVRSDLLASKRQADEMADRLASMLTAALPERARA